jgi:hypothetical protein
MEKLENLNLLKGVDKWWIWGNKENRYKAWDCIQKINYSIQDLNNEQQNLSNPSMKEVVFVVVLVDWICEAMSEIVKTLKPEVAQKYTYKNEKDIQKALQFFKAVRSFLVAHPLSTNRHKQYGFDGDMICVDIRKGTSPIARNFISDENWFMLDFEGLKETTRKQPADFVLYAYSKKLDNMEYFKFICVDFKDLYRVAELQIQKLYDLDKYLNNLKKKDIERIL